MYNGEKSSFFFVCLFVFNASLQVGIGRILDQKNKEVRESKGFL